MSAFRYIKNSLEGLIKKTKDFLLSKASKEALVFLIFFAIASIFWFVRVLNDDYVIDVTVPIRIQNVPNNVIITQNLPSTLTFKVKDKGSVLLGYKLGEKSFSPIGINFNDYRSDSQISLINTNAIDRNNLSQFATSTKIVSVYPSTVELAYTTGRCRILPVVLTGSVRADRQYYISDTLIYPVKVKVYAPQKILDKLKAVYTQPVDLKGINSTTFCQLSLRNINGVKLVPQKIKVAFHTDVYSEKKIEVPIVGTGFPNNKRLLTFPSKATVSFQVGSSLFKQIGDADFAIELPYEMLCNYPFDKYPLRLSRMPRGVRNVQISPTQVDFLIEQK